MFAGKAQSINIMEVVTDAVPSLARPVESSRLEPTEDGKPEKDVQQERGIPVPPSPKQDQPNSSEVDGHSETIGRSPSQSQKGQTKYSKRRSRSSTTQQNGVINISGSCNVSIGNSYTFNINPTKKDKQYTRKYHEPNSLSDREKKMVVKLQRSPKAVTTEDIIIVSEHIDGEGLRNLAHLLGMEEVEINVIADHFKEKGPAEVAYHTLQKWNERSNRGTNQSAMLSVLCDKLVLIYNHGGRGALQNLYRRHFPGEPEI